ncbi:MAG: histidine phosphatase family protein [Candidatus Omnitrophota bacterium]
MNITRLILIRHGQTDYNLQNRYYGVIDPGLNGEGIKQAEQLKFEMRRYNIDEVYSSDLRRAYDTAKLVFENYNIQKCSNFREINFGILEGLTHEEIMDRYPKLYGDWLEDPENISLPQGEGVKDLTRRVLRGVIQIVKRHKGRTVSIVTHGGPIRVLINFVNKNKPNEFWKIRQETAAINIFEYDNNLVPKIVISNNVSHLKKTRKA